MKKFSRFVPLMALFLVLLLFLPQRANAATSGYYTYTVSGGKATITDVDTAISGDVTIPSTLDGYPVTRIGSSAFYNCTSLTSITIPDSVTSIGNNAFQDCTSLTSVTIPDSVTAISDYAFYNCTSLISVTIPDSVTSIGFSAFSGCKSLTSITIPDSVTRIGSYAFYYCTSLTGIWVDEDNTTYSNDDSGVLFNKAKTQLIQAPGGIKGGYTIPDSVTSIGDRAFTSCTSLTSVTIGDSVTSIGSYVFFFCDSLTSITIPDSVTAISNYAFYYCTSLTSITIPDSVTSIGDGAFDYCTSLASVTIPDSVTSIGDFAFSSCDSLTGITIPDSVTSIGSYAFSSCDSLKHVAYGGTSAQWSKISIGNNNTKLTGASVWHYGATQDDVYYTKNCINAGIYCHLCNDFITKEKEESGEHSYDHSCDEECDDCGEIRIVTHNYAWVVDKAETCGENGSKHEECTACHNVRNAETVIEATGNHTYETGSHVCSVCGYGRTVTAIAIGKAPTKRYYSLLRDELDVTGGTIIVTYSDGTTEEIAVTADMVTSFYIRKYGRQSLQVNYCGARAYFTIIVQADYTPDKLEILTKPKTSYIFGDSLELAGLTLKATYEDVEVELALDEVTVDAVDMTTTGCKTVTVRYYDAVATFSVFVHEKVWVTIDSALYPESKHNYAANTNETKTFTHPGAEQLKLTFSEKSYTESSCDFVYILDGSGNEIGKYSGTLSGKVVTVPGDTVQIKLTSDSSVNKYGYAFATIEAYGAEHPGETICDICGQLKDTNAKSVVLSKDVITDSMTIPTGATLDLNGYTLTVDSLASFGQIIDSVGGGGLIANNIEISGNDWLPIKDENGCYRFYEHEQKSLGTKTTSDGVSFGFALDFVDETAYTTLLESDDVQITITLDWGSGSKDYAFSRELVAKYVDWVRKYPSLQPAMQLNVTGLDSLADGTVITVTPSISAVGGKLQTTGAIMTYTA